MRQPRTYYRLGLEFGRLLRNCRANSYLWLERAWAK